LDELTGRVFITQPQPVRLPANAAGHRIAEVRQLKPSELRDLAWFEQIWVEGDGDDGPGESRLLFRTADGGWVIRDPHITTPYRRMRFYWANAGEALRFLESVDVDAGVIDRYFPDADPLAD